MRRLAVMVAGIGFFALAIVGWASGLSPLVCGLRAAGGAAALYVIVTIAGRIVLRIMVDAVIRTLNENRESKR